MYCTFCGDRYIPPRLTLPGKRAGVRIKYSIVVFVEEEKLHSVRLNFEIYVTGVEFSGVEYT